MMQLYGFKYFRHSYLFPASSAPSWAQKVDRWHQLDAYSFGMIDAYASHHGELATPDLILLASPSASNDIDRQFVLSGAKSPLKMVHTLPNIRCSPLVKFMRWGGPVLCLQKDPQTLLTALLEGLDFLGPCCRNVMIWGAANESFFPRLEEHTTPPPPRDGVSPFAVHIFSLTFLASEAKKDNGSPPYIIRRSTSDLSLSCPDDRFLVDWLLEPGPKKNFIVNPETTISHSIHGGPPCPT